MLATRRCSKNAGFGGFKLANAVNILVLGAFNSDLQEQSMKMCFQLSFARKPIAKPIKLNDSTAS